MEKTKTILTMLSVILVITAVSLVLLIVLTATRNNSGSLVLNSSSQTRVAQADVSNNGACVILPDNGKSSVSSGSGTSNSNNTCDASVNGCGFCLQQCNSSAKIVDRYGCPPDGADGYCNPGHEASDPDCCQFTESQVTQSGHPFRPQESAGKIVFEDAPTGDYGNYDIFMCNRALNGQPGGCLVGDTKTQVTTNSQQQTRSDIDGNRIVWQDGRSGSGDIYMYDLGADGLFGTADDGGESRVSSSPSGESQPVISGDHIAWTLIDSSLSIPYILVTCQLSLNGHTGGCLATDTKTVIANAHPSQIALSGNKLVWSDTWAGNFNLYLYDFSTGFTSQLPTTGYVGEPDVSGNVVVWNAGYILSYDLGPDGIYGTADDGGEHQVTPDGYVRQPRIDGDRMVWEDEHYDTNGVQNFYLYTCQVSKNGTPGGCLANDLKKRVESNRDVDWYPQVVDGEAIVWTSQSGNIQRVDLASCNQ